MKRVYVLILLSFATTSLCLSQNNTKELLLGKWETEYVDDIKFQLKVTEDSVVIYRVYQMGRKKRASVNSSYTRAYIIKNKRKVILTHKNNDGTFETQIVKIRKINAQELVIMTKLKKILQADERLVLNFKKKE
ncbi:MAG: hypothetical protein K8R41_05755 [Bacteroidales bacterium]|nr:hypothetical protein [Bacteroidales bacterium]